MDKPLSLNPRVRFRKIADNGVLVHMDDGRVIVVNEVGHAICEMLEKPVSRGDIVDSLTTLFDVEAEQAEADVSAFIEQMEAENALA